MTSPSRSPSRESRHSSVDDDRDDRDKNDTVAGGRGVTASSSSTAAASGQVDEVSRCLAAHKRTPSVFILDLDSTL